MHSLRLSLLYRGFLRDQLWQSNKVAGLRRCGKSWLYLVFSPSSLPNITAFISSKVQEIMATISNKQVYYGVRRGTLYFGVLTTTSVTDKIFSAKI